MKRTILAVGVLALIAVLASFAYAGDVGNTNPRIQSTQAPASEVADQNLTQKIEEGFLALPINSRLDQNENPKAVFGLRITPTGLVDAIAEIPAGTNCVQRPLAIKVIRTLGLPLNQTVLSTVNAWFDKGGILAQGSTQEVSRTMFPNLSESSDGTYTVAQLISACADALGVNYPHLSKFAVSTLSGALMQDEILVGVGTIKAPRQIMTFRGNQIRGFRFTGTMDAVPANFRTVAINLNSVEGESSAAQHVVADALKALNHSVARRYVAWYDFTAMQHASRPDYLATSQYERIMNRFKAAYDKAESLEIADAKAAEAIRRELNRIERDWAKSSQKSLAAVASLFDESSDGANDAAPTKKVGRDTSMKSGKVGGKLANDLPTSRIR